MRAALPFHRVEVHTRGRLPHVGITGWLTRQVNDLSAGPFALPAEDLQAAAP